MTIAGQSVKETQGMTLRDYFAGQALAGLNASLSSSSDWPTGNTIEVMTQNAYSQADAMITARKGGPQS